MADADPAHYVRGQYDGYREIDGVAPDSTPRPTPRSGSRSTTGAGPACRSSSAPASGCPSSQTELRLVFKHPPRLHFIPSGAPPPASPARSSSRSIPAPASGSSSTPTAPTRPGRPEIELDMEFAEEGGEGATPYEVLLHAAMVGDSTHFTRQDSVEESWRIVQPLLDSPPRSRLRAGVVGAGRGRRLVGRARRLARPVAPGVFATGARATGLIRWPRQYTARHIAARGPRAPRP